MNKKLEEKIEAVHNMSIEKLCEKFNCTPEEICLGDYIARETNDTVCPFKVILGFANFECSNVIDLGPLEVVYGRKRVENGVPARDINGNICYSGINLRNSKIVNLGKLRKVYGSFSLNDKIQSLCDLEFLGSGLYLNKTQIKTINKDLIIDGILNAEFCMLESLGAIKKVKHLNLNTKYLKSFGNLEVCFKVTFGSECNKKLIQLFNNKFTKQNGMFVRNDLITSIEE